MFACARAVRAVRACVRAQARAPGAVRFRELHAPAVDPAASGGGPRGGLVPRARRRSRQRRRRREKGGDLILHLSSERDGSPRFASLRLAASLELAPRPPVLPGAVSGSRRLSKSHLCSFAHYHHEHRHETTCVHGLNVVVLCGHPLQPQRTAHVAASVSSRKINTSSCSTLHVPRHVSTYSA